MKLPLRDFIICTALFFVFNVGVVTGMGLGSAEDPSRWLRVLVVMGAAVIHAGVLWLLALNDRARLEHYVQVWKQHAHDCNAEAHAAAADAEKQREAVKRLVSSLPPPFETQEYGTKEGN